MEIRKIDAEQTWELRHKVMWPDKEYHHVKLTDDQVGMHYGLFDKGMLISVISLFTDDDHNVQLRKFATDQDCQSKGYGTKLLCFVLEQARNLGAHKVWCNARKNKIVFYEKFEFYQVGKEFYRDGIEYVLMSKTYYHSE